MLATSLLPMLRTLQGCVANMVGWRSIGSLHINCSSTICLRVPAARSSSARSAVRWLGGEKSIPNTPWDPNGRPSRRCDGRPSSQRKKHTHTHHTQTFSFCCAEKKKSARPSKTHLLLILQCPVCISLILPLKESTSTRFADEEWLLRELLLGPCDAGAPPETTGMRCSRLRWI